MLQKINVDNPKFNLLSDIDKTKYKMFLVTLLKLARSTKQLHTKNSLIDSQELPTLSIVDINENLYIIEYINDKWMLSKNNTNRIIFNPTLSGISNFLDKFDFDHIESGVNLYQETIDDLSLKYGINY